MCLEYCALEELKIPPFYGRVYRQQQTRFPLGKEETPKLLRLHFRFMILLSLSDGILNNITILYCVCRVDNGWRGGADKKRRDRGTIQMRVTGIR